MIYKIFNEPRYPTMTQILFNRGLDVDIQDTWMYAGKDQIYDESLFGQNMVDKLVERILQAIAEEDNITVIVDSDADGFTSAAIFINYLYARWPEFALNRIDYILHTGKQHGLADTYEQILEDGWTNLVVIPDAGTNDVFEMQQLLDQGIDIICMDHHHSDVWNENAIIVNNQICDYPNKSLSGAGVTWHMCRAIDKHFDDDCSSDLIDLAALGNLSDMMDYRSIETKAIISLGLDNIKNPFFYYMTEKNEYSISKMGGINYMSIAFYVTPFINAIVRSGTPEEKDMIFKSFLQMYAFEEIPSGKRGHKGEMVPRVEEAVRICTNVKARQTKLQDTTMALLEHKIDQDNLLCNAILILRCEPGEVEKNLAGLVANKLQAKYQRPCLVLIKSKTKDDKEVFYRGSARNYSMSEIQDMRQLCEDTGDVEYAQGHDSAFGISIPESKLEDFIESTNEKYKDVPSSPIYWVDFVWSLNTMSIGNILDIADSKEYWGQEIPEPYICIANIEIKPHQVQLLSPDKHPTIKIHLDNGIDIMKFKSSQEEYETFIGENKILTAVCRAAKNEWMGNVSAQLIIEDYYLREEWVF